MRQRSLFDAPGGPEHHGVLVVDDGDLLACEAQTLINPVNCAGVMGAGLALAFARAYPQCVAPYKRACRTGELRPGRPVLWRPDDPAAPWIVHLATKDHWRQPSAWPPIRDAIRWLSQHRQRLCVVSVGCPALGCGLGGLPWERYRQPLTDELERLGVPVWLFAPR